MRKFTKEQREEWIAELRADLKPGDKIYTVLRGVAKSGMSRKIDVYRFVYGRGEIQKRWLSPRVAAICGYRFDEKNECLHVEGGGMDMGFEVVYDLGRALWPEGFNPGEQCLGFKGQPHYKVLATRPVDGKTVDVNVGRGAACSGPLTKPEVDALTEKGFVFTRGRNGDTSGWDNDGGYALRQEWL